MRIVQICTNATSGSVGSIVRNLCDELQKKGHQYLICFGRGKNPEGYNYFKFDYKLDIYGHVLLARLFDSDGLHSKLATKRLIKKLESYKPDIVHLHCLHGYYINYPLLFKYLKESNIKVIWTMHDCWAFTGHCCYFDYINCNQWKNRCKKCKQSRSYPKSYFSYSYKNHDSKKKLFTELDDCTIVTPSIWLADLIKQTFFNKYRVVTINNGINTDVFKLTYDNEVLRKYNIDINKKTILCVASIWDKRKGLADALELINYIPDNVQLIIVGIDEKQVNNALSGVICIPRTEDIHELATIYTFATLLFNPTYEDNYPTVNIEAIACGTPVVTYDTGGSPEIIKKTNSGIIIKQRDYRTLLKYLNQCNDKLNMINIPKEILSYKNMCNKYLELYLKRN